MLLGFFIWHQPSILWMGVALITKRVVNTCPRIQRQCYISHSFHSQRHYNSHVVAMQEQDGALQCIIDNMYQGEWACCMHSKAFKDKARLQIHSKSFGLKEILIVLNTFICKILKCKASFISKFKIACVAMCTLVMNCYSRDLLVLSQLQ